MIHPTLEHVTMNVKAWLGVPCQKYPEVELV